MIRSSILIGSLFFCLSIMGQEVYKIGQTGIKSADGLIFYSLPKTTVLVKVQCSRTSIHAGPYFAYAEELLGIKGLPSEDKTEWRIDSILFEAVQEADPEATYAIKPDKNFCRDVLLKFSKHGLIFDYSSELSEDYAVKMSDKVDNSAPVYFDEFSVNGFVAESFDTLYKTVIKDTMYVKVPVLKPKTSLKTLREKAKDAADMISKIRARKFDLIMAEDDPFAEVNVLKYAISELDKIEKAYLDMFTGKKISKTYTYVFQHTPELKEQNAELFRFSASSGVAGKPDAQTAPVFISFEKEGKVGNLKEWLNNIPESKGSMYYRIPEITTAKIIFKGNVIAFKKLPVSQFGATVPYSLK